MVEAEQAGIPCRFDQFPVLVLFFLGWCQEQKGTRGGLILVSRPGAVELPLWSAEKGSVSRLAAVYGGSTVVRVWRSAMSRIRPVGHGGGGCGRSCRVG